MKTLITTLLFCLSLSILSNAQATRWQQAMTCEMDIDMNDETHQFTGSQKLTYENNSPDDLDQVFYYLFFNAFQPGSMMDVRSRTISDPDSRVGDRISQLDESQQGYQRVKSLTMDGTPVDFKVVGTILEVNLPETLKSGKKAVFEMEFEAQVPLQIRRSGRQNAEGVRYSMTQWFPKMCEYDCMGWHAVPYVGREFHGVWGDYEVNITIDASYVIGATGVLQNPDEIGHGYSAKEVKHKSGSKLTWKFKAENVIDFAWAADADFLHTKLQVENGPLLHFIHQDDEEINATWKELEQYSADAMTFFSENYGKYPYPQYTIIQGGDGGMEYPMITLITGNRSLGSLVGVTAHEMAHSWFQGLLATNESLYEWMDEGFTTYASGECMTVLFGDQGEPVNYRSLGGYIRLAKSGDEEPLSTHADHYSTNYAYGSAAYSKGSVFLNQLRYIVGEEDFRAGMLEYFDMWAFHHPNPNDFIRIFEKRCKMELDWYLQYFVNSTKTIDYGISEVRTVDGKTSITLGKFSEMPMPLDVVVTYTDGSKHMHYIPMVIMRGEKKEEAGYSSWTVEGDWPWVNPTYTLELDRPFSDIQSVVIDGTYRLADVNPSNNVLMNEPGAQFIYKLQDAK
ncbi:MAG: M1 family metallopeptidase [Flavobacteriales bacterium]